MTELLQRSILFLGSVYALRGYPVSETSNAPSGKDWYALGQQQLQAKLKQSSDTKVAQNVIVFVGDGMGVSSVTAARVYRQQAGVADPSLSFEKFPNSALSKTYSVDNMVSDSAATATAILAGVKTKQNTLGLNQHVIHGNCSSSKGNQVQSVLHDSLKKGKSVGIVTTTRVTHATPAAAYAHSADRNWESDVTDRIGNCSDIAHQLVFDNPDIQVILGGGRQYFMPENETDAWNQNLTGNRKDNISLIQEWISDKQSRSLPHAYVTNRDELMAVNLEETDYLFGLFAPNHLAYEVDRDKEREPSLTEMVEKAIQILRKNSKGYFLLVEAGRIDHAHHASNAKRAIFDTIQLSDAVEKAVHMVDRSATLLVVTADHSHTLTIGGYPSWNAHVLDSTDYGVGNDNMPYTILTYANGPGYSVDESTGRRANITSIDTAGDDYKQQSAVPLYSETHGGEEVPIYARGPMSHLFSGIHEQSYIAHVIAHASCIGPQTSHCVTKFVESTGVLFRVSNVLSYGAILAVIKNIMS